jgi:hypothetical protein
MRLPLPPLLLLMLLFPFLIRGAADSVLQVSGVLSLSGSEDPAAVTPAVVVLFKAAVVVTELQIWLHFLHNPLSDTFPLQ